MPKYTKGLKKGQMRLINRGEKRLSNLLSRWQDLNLRPPAPKAGWISYSGLSIKVKESE